MAIVTTSEVKRVLQIADESKDPVIDMIIPAAEDYVREYTNNDFTTGYPQMAKMATIKFIGLHLKSYDSQQIKSESVPEHSVTYTDNDIENGLKTQVDPLLKGYKKLKWQ